MKDLKMNEIYQPFTFYGYVPFNDNRVEILENIFYSKLIKGEFEVRNKGKYYEIDTNMGTFMLSNCTYSLTNSIKVSVALDGLTFGGLSTNTLLLNLIDGTDNAIFLNKKMGKKIMEYCERITDNKVTELAIGYDRKKLSSKKVLFEKIEKFITEL